MFLMAISLSFDSCSKNNDEILDPTPEVKPDPDVIDGIIQFEDSK